MQLRTLKEQLLWVEPFETGSRQQTARGALRQQATMPAAADPGH